MTKMETTYLEQASSLELQERYIIHGTKDEYILPEDILNGLYWMIQREKKKKETKGMNQELVELEKIIDQHDEEAYESNSDLVYSDEWKRIRELSSKLLNQLETPKVEQGGELNSERLRPSS